MAVNIRADRYTRVNSNPTYVSPTDSMMTPVSQKLNAAKKKHFTKYDPLRFECIFAFVLITLPSAPKPMQPLFPTKSSSSESEASDDEDEKPARSSEDMKLDDDDENPF